MRDIADWFHTAAGFWLTAIGTGLLQFLVYYPYDCEGGLLDTQVQANSCETAIGISVSPDLSPEAAASMAIGLSIILAGLLYAIAGAMTHNDPDGV